MQNDPYYEFWRKYWIHVIFAAAALVALTGAWLWCNRIQTNPERVFWGMIEHSLTTSSVTIQAAQTAPGGSSSVKQTVALSLGAENMARAYITVKQPGAEVITEVIGTPAADYTRYVKADITSAATGKKPDTKSLTNIWATSKPQLFSQTVLGLGLSLGSIPVPLLHTDGEQRAKLMKEIHERNLYQVGFNKIAKEHRAGRLYYTYEVKVTPFVYVQIMKLTAKDLGITLLNKVDPADYRELKPLIMHLTVDVRAHELTKVAYEGGSYTQTYSAYGVPADTSLPAKYITLDELRQKFSALIQQ